MVALIAWLFLNAGFQAPLAWFILGLFFSLIGDILLMLPKDPFIAGLGAFLMAHLCYLVGLNQGFPPANLASLAIAVLLIITYALLSRPIFAALRASRQERMIWPILIYSIVINLMLFSALITLVRPEWKALPALLVSSGAFLFYFSDILLGWNKFVAPVRHGQLINIVTYHLGQMLLVLGAALHFLA